MGRTQISVRHRSYTMTTTAPVKIVTTSMIDAQPTAGKLASDQSAEGNLANEQPFAAPETYRIIGVDTPMYRIAVSLLQGPALGNVALILALIFQVIVVDYLSQWRDGFLSTSSPAMAAAMIFAAIATALGVFALTPMAFGLENNRTFHIAIGLASLFQFAHMVVVSQDTGSVNVSSGARCRCRRDATKAGQLRCRREVEETPASQVRCRRSASDAYSGEEAWALVFGWFSVVAFLTTFVLRIMESRKIKNTY